jgi:hypothetical protein
LSPTGHFDISSERMDLPFPRSQLLMRFTFQSVLIASSLLCLLATGCATIRTTDTSRTGLEQLLLSDAVDKSLDRTPLPPVDGRKVFVDTQFLDCVDKGYLIGSLRQRLLISGASLVDKKEDSEVTMELVSGGIGTDNSNSFMGMPSVSLPGMISLPEVRVYDKSKQAGTAKIAVVAYDTKTGSMLYDSGSILAISEDQRWSVMGMGPFMEGDVRNQMRSANRRTISAGARTATKQSPDTSWK